MKKIDFYFVDIPMSLLNLEDTADFLLQESDKKAGVIIREDVNAYKFVLNKSDLEVHGCLNSSNVTNADGMSVVLAAKLLYKIDIPRVTGCDLFFLLIKKCYAHRKKVYLLGAKPGTIEQLNDNISNKYSNDLICGYHHGYFDEDSYDEVFLDILKSEPDIIFIGMPSPAKEKIIMALKSRLCHGTILMGVGGTFDVATGLVSRAPNWVQKMGFEWLYRLLQEPKKLWKRYLITNTFFIFLIIKEFIQIKLKRHVR